MKKIILMLTFILIALSLTSCKKKMGDDGYALLSLLFNNRMTLILKGTYATDNPLSMSEINNNKLFIDPDDGTPVSATYPSYSDLPIYIDIGEVRLSTKRFVPDPSISALMSITQPQAAEKFWDVLAPRRQVYCSQFYSVDGKFDACRDTGGFINYHEYMNGHGAVYPSQDVGPGFYVHAGVYIRALVTGWARRSENPDIALIDQFDNNKVVGANIITRVQYPPDMDPAGIQISPPAFFPLHYQMTWGQQSSMFVDNSTIPLVVEIRSNIKENMMIHTFSTGKDKLSLVAFSDWKKPHTKLAQINLGGNVLTRARMIYPDRAVDLKINNGGAGGKAYYYAIYFQNECGDMNGSIVCDKDNSFLPLAATPARAGGDNILTGLMDGIYELQCRQDASPVDGYPEKVLSRKLIDIGAGPMVMSTNFSCP